MIKSWKHKGLKQFYETGSTAKILVQHARRLAIILQLLDAADKLEKLDLPGFDFHKLKGQYKKFYVVKVNANWRVIFQFDGEDAALVDYLDYH
ncbi:MAG: hypothetical protein A3F10_01275 [Coxiella sp. RIFCSPHIGHO2_12_FULL_42_15]|nr:MAG: hypothetical protein A3F10_01275 [Coxiella sp. RIFCSPHIGHO2_12_FULL_42_15]